MSYEKVIISLDIMKADSYEKLKKFLCMEYQSNDDIWKYYPKIDAKVYDSHTMFNTSPILETLLFLEYIKDKNITYELWYDKSLFIFNDDLYTILNDGKEIQKVDLTNTIFTTLRETFGHPFFSILQHVLQKHNGKLAKPNIQTMKNNGCMNKFYAFNELYPQRKIFLGDFLLPYNIKQHDMPLFVEFIKNNIGNKIVLKYDCIQEGKGVVFKDLTKQNSLKEVSEILKFNKTKGKEVFITPAYEILSEYRCYFRNEENQQTIFSIKKRINSTEVDVYLKENIQIYKNISAKWYEIRTDSLEFEFGERIAKDILKFLSYDTGCIEFAKTIDDKIVFFEVNQMAGPLPFEGEDTQNMTAFYHSIFDKIIT